MMRETLTLFLAIAMAVTGQARVLTLDECQSMAEEHYPLIAQVALQKEFSALDVDNISKQWLPQVTASIQGTMQNRVPGLPTALTGILEQMGGNVNGISKGQYRAAVDVSQIIYDGGAIAAAKEVTRSEHAVNTAQTRVELYALRQRVNTLYFGILMLDENLAINKDLQSVLADNLRRIEVMQRHGTAAGGDVAAIKAQLLSAQQQQVSLRSQRAALLRVLSLFVGLAHGTELELVKPQSPEMALSRRPEFQLFDSQLQLLDTRREQLRAAIMPRVSAFAQGYYGYTGYDMFHDMMHRAPTFNAMLGVRVTWNVGSLYTRHNDLSRLNLQRDLVQSNRETFLLNNAMSRAQEDETIAGYREMMNTDDEIISLRTTVRKAAESKLNHGIIDVNGLLQEISRENQARIERSTHELEWLHAQYRQSFNGQ